MKFKIVGYAGDGDYIIEGINLSEQEMERYGSTKQLRADLFVGGSFHKLREKEKNLTELEFFKKHFEGKIVEIDSFNPYLLLANMVEIVDEINPTNTPD